MKYRTIIAGLILSILFIVSASTIALANVPGVAINAPPPPPAANVPVQGGTGMIKVVVAHRDTMMPATHYVDHVYLYDGDKMIKEWKYTEANANPNEVYVESLTQPAMKDMNLKAIAHCTMHGYSSANVYVTVLPQGTTPKEMATLNAQGAGLQINGIADTSKAAGMVNAQDYALISQLAASEMNNIQQHQMQTADFLKSSQGQQFLSLFDYTSKQAAGGQQQAAGMGQQQAAGMGQQQAAGMGQQAGMAGQQQGAGAGNQTMSGMAASPARQSNGGSATGMGQQAGGQQQGAQQSGMQGAQQSGMQGAQQTGGQQASGMGQQAMSGSQGIPQTMCTDSFGNPVNCQQVMQLGKSAGQQQGAQAGMAGQQQAGQQQGMTGQQAGAAGQQQGAQQQGAQQSGAAGGNVSPTPSARPAR